MECDCGIVLAGFNRNIILETDIPADRLTGEKTERQGKKARGYYLMHKMKSVCTLHRFILQVNI